MRGGKGKHMAQKLVVPKFANESEEARWWFDHQDAVDDEFDLAEQEGRLGRGTVARRANAAAAAIALDPEDIERARVQAERRGIEYQAYVKMVVHQALLSEEKSA
jgi:predicted DNA binding CopG/RHH family protein